MVLSYLLSVFQLWTPSRKLFDFVKSAEIRCLRLSSPRALCGCQCC